MITKRKPCKKVVTKTRKLKGKWLGLSRKYKGLSHKEMGWNERRVMSKKTGTRWKKGDSIVRVLKRKPSKLRF